MAAGDHLGDRRAMGVRPPSVTAMVKRLAALGLGEARALSRRRADPVRRARRPRGDPPPPAARAVPLPGPRSGPGRGASEADRLEHALSEELEARIDRSLGHPDTDPHGDPIPDAELRDRRARAANAWRASSRETRPRSAGCPGATTRLLRYLSKLALVPGKKVKLRRVEPFGGPLVVARREGGARDLARARRGDRGRVTWSKSGPKPQPARSVRRHGARASGRGAGPQRPSGRCRGERRGLRALLPFLGPAFVAAVAYVDPATSRPTSPRREVRLRAPLGRADGEPDGDGRPVALGEARDRDRAEPGRGLPRPLPAAGHVVSCGSRRSSSRWRPTSPSSSAPRSGCDPVRHAALRWPG